mgnify:CR=1 FL=1
MHSFLTLSFYYWIITFSILGFGLLFNQIFLKSSEKNIGYLGIYGIFVLILISYVSSFFIPHSELFNSILILIGLINLIVNRGEIVVNKNIKNLIIIFLIFNIFILVSKNHDDFSYYHFPYTHLLTEYSNMIGLGNFNHGFRTHSSIFYLSSLFNLPFSDLYLLHLSPVYFIGFANLIFYNRIFLSLKSKEKSFILYLSLLSLIFINIFFYRLAEHGTDRSAMILIIVAVIEILYLINQKNNINKDYFLRLLILITLIISLKTFYILYVLLLFPVIFYVLDKKTLLLFLFKNKVLYLCLILFFSLLTVNFFNTGCLLYPVKILCFENFSWSIPLNEVEQMNNWYQQWAKAGANPNYRVDNPENYIKNFNWVNNWMDNYFFNKVSDFLFGLLFLTFFIFLVFYSKKIRKVKKSKFLIIYFILIFLTFQWFYFLPTLRYGGYHLIALLFFIPFSLILEKFLVKPDLFKKKVYFLIVLTMIIFLGRNTFRLIDEYEIYNYNVFNNTYFRKDEKNFQIFKRIKNINKCNIKKELSSCSDDNIKVKILNGYYVYYKESK